MEEDQWGVDHSKYKYFHVKDVVRSMGEVVFIFSLVLFTVTGMDILVQRFLDHQSWNLLCLWLLYQVSYFEIYLDKIRDLLDGKFCISYVTKWRWAWCGALNLRLRGNAHFLGEWFTFKLYDWCCEGEFCSWSHWICAPASAVLWSLIKNQWVQRILQTSRHVWASLAMYILKVKLQFKNVHSVLLRFYC